MLAENCGRVGSQLEVTFTRGPRRRCPQVGFEESFRKRVSAKGTVGAKTGKFDSELRYPGEDDVYENPRMNVLHL
jgi:hypothetical protein